MLRPFKNFFSYFQKNINKAVNSGTETVNMNTTDTTTTNTDSNIITYDKKSSVEVINEEAFLEIVEESPPAAIESSTSIDIFVDVNEPSSATASSLSFKSILSTTTATTVTTKTSESSLIHKNDIIIIEESDDSSTSNESHKQKQQRKDRIALINNNVDTNDDNDNDYSDDCNVASIDLVEDDEKYLIENYYTDYSTREFLIINDTLNNSPYTIDQGSDPLAFDDDFPLVTPDTSLPPVSDLVSSTNGNIVYIIDVDEIRDQNIQIEQNIISKTTKNLAEKTTSTIKINNDEQEIRSDGSDSGLGSEISAGLKALISNCTNIGNTASQIEQLSQAQASTPKPLQSNLKRRSNLEMGSSIEKRSKKSINFDGVKIYYFPRMQGFSCIPSQGGCTLGMGSRHIGTKTLTLAEHATEQRRAHRLQMQEVNPRGSSSEESDSDYEVSEADASDVESESIGFLQPVPVKQRRALLKGSGIRKIDSVEKNECRAIRSSREFCGCSCRGYCDPDTCACSLAGIKCQVDRPNFPCGCTRDGCANIIGRVEFNPGRVRTHYIHTIMRLDLENKQIRTNEEVDNSITTRTLIFGNNSCDTNYLNGLNNIFHSPSNNDGGGDAAAASASNDNVRVAESYGTLQPTPYNENFLPRTVGYPLMNSNNQLPNSRYNFEQDESLLHGMNNCEASSFHQNINEETFGYQMPSNINTTNNLNSSNDYQKRMMNPQLYQFGEQSSYNNYNNQSFQNYLNTSASSSHATNIETRFSVSNTLSNSPLLPKIDLTVAEIGCDLANVNNLNTSSNILAEDHDENCHHRRHRPISNCITNPPFLSRTPDPSKLSIHHTAVSNANTSCKLASSAQTSTSISEGTSTCSNEGTSTAISSLTTIDFKQQPSNIIDLTTNIDDDDNNKKSVPKYIPKNKPKSKPKKSNFIINDDFECFVNMFNVEENITNHIISKKKHSHSYHNNGHGDYNDDTDNDEINTSNNYANTINKQYTNTTTKTTTNKVNNCQLQFINHNNKKEEEANHVNDMMNVCEIRHENNRSNRKLNGAVSIGTQTRKNHSDSHHHHQSTMNLKDCEINQGNNDDDLNCAIDVAH